MKTERQLLVGGLCLAMVFWLGAGTAYGQCTDVTIGGAVYTGTGTVTYTMDALGEPIAHRNPVYAPAAPPLTVAANNVQVMIQDMDGGAVVTYGTFAAGGNTWSACVPAGGVYMAMFSATDHNLTSRVFDLPAGDLLKDAYLPALYMNLDTGAVDPATEPIEPLGNLLVYAFEEYEVNGAPDGGDPGLPGVLFELYDPRTGATVASGTSLAGSGEPTAILTKDGLAIPGAIAAGHFYFEDIVPGTYALRAIPPGHAGNTAPADDAAGMPWADGWYHTYTMEGTQDWEILVYPGDPGTEAGAFMAWFGFVKKLGQLAPGTGGTTISGVVEDADVPWEAPIAGGEPEPPEAGAPLDDVYRHQGISVHGLVPNAFLIMWRRIGDVSSVVATTEADPVTGAFSIENVPAGTYKIFLSDKPLHWVFGEVEMTVDGVNDVVFTPFAQEIPGMPLAILPRFAARVNGFVIDDATGIGIGGATVNLRYQGGNAAFTVITEANGWYNFEWLPEIETMAFIDVEPPAGYRGKLVTDTYYPTAYVPPDPNCDPNVFPNCPIVPDPCNPATDPGCVIPGDPLDVERNGMNRWVQYYTANYKSDLILEPVPAGVGQIEGIVYGDSLAKGTWVGDGVYDKVGDSVVEGVTIELLDASGMPFMIPDPASTPEIPLPDIQDPATVTTSGTFDPLVAAAQGNPLVNVPPDEWGGFFSGPMPGFFEFRDVAAGDYSVRVVPPNGFSAVDGIDTFAVAVAGGARNGLEIGIHTGVPRAGILEGGVFDDQFLDHRWYSAFSEEKQLLVGIGVTVRDHLGYQLDTLVQPSGVCYLGSSLAADAPAGYVPQAFGFICDRPELGNSVEIDRLVPPDLHIYYGNDPALPECTGVDPTTGLPNGTSAPGDPPCHNPNLFRLELPYTMGQGLAKFEADWSLPMALVAGGAPPAVGCPQSIHLSALSGSSSPGEEGKWSATINVTVRDPLGFLPGAEVFANWSNGEESEAITNGNGNATLFLETVEDADFVTATLTVDPPEGAGGVFNGACGVGDCIEINAPSDPGFILCGVTAAFCGDNTCDAGEDVCNCAADCGLAPIEDCTDGIDNDCDGFIDCDDGNCVADAACAIPWCGNGTCDGDETVCSCPADCGAIPAENTVAACSDGIDNDCDGDADCADWDCEIVAPCLPFCGDGICGSGEDYCNCAADCDTPPVADCTGTTIGGTVYSGTGTVTYTMNALGEPVVHRNAVLAPAALTLTQSANNAAVMIQDMHTGDIVTYGTFDPGPADYTWTACVPAGGTYIAMFKADGHDLTSRVFDLAEPANPTTMDAYLPALYQNIDTGVVDPATEPIQPLGNLLLFAFEENEVNGAADGVDPGLPGVLMELYNPKTGLVVASGTTMSGSGSPTGITTKDGLNFPPEAVGGMLYLEDIAPGEYGLRAIPPGHPGNPAEALDAAGDPWTNGWYHTYTMEGGKDWEILIYPGDPGTEAGAFIAWFGFVKKLGQIPGGGGGSSIIGTVEDADIAWEPPMPGNPEPPEAGAPLDTVWRNQGVSTHLIVPDALLILWQRIGDISTVIATVEADPVTGEFSIDNVPAGTYSIFLTDLALHWVFGVIEITVDGVNDVVFPLFINEVMGMPKVVLPRFAARVNGFVVDDATGIGVSGATVNLRYQGGNAAQSVVTDATGWYNFEFLGEIETMAFIDVEPPAGYRGKLVTDTYYPTAVVPWDLNCDANLHPNCPIINDPCDPATDPVCVIPGDPLDVERNGMSRWVQYYTAAYKSDLILEPVPTDFGQIEGIVYYESLAMGTWLGNGLYDKVDESVVEGATVELIDDTGHVVAATTSGTYDPLVAVAQGYIQPGISVPPDEWGGFFSGPMSGFYEFRDVAAGDYTVRVTPPNGGCANGPNPAIVTVTAGARVDLDVGVHSAVPRAGTIEGGVFDDVFLDWRWYSAFSMEKQLLVGIGVTVQDYLGYQLDTLVQPSAVCYPLTTTLDPAATPVPYGAICDRPDLGQDVEIHRLVAPGMRLYWGNDPNLPPCDAGNMNAPCFDETLFNMELPYTMGQGMAKFEADWSLPAAIAPPTVPFDGCGRLIQGVECVLFEDDAAGGLHLLDNMGAFVVGDRVQVTGTQDAACVATCMQGEDCILGNAIVACAPLCGDGICEGAEDCTTCAADCAEPEDCADGLDNDCDGLADCADLDSCLFFAPCLCGNGVCDAGDGEDCATCPGDCTVAEDCADGVDNDCDGLIDCDDADCAGDPACAVCGDGTCDAGEDLCGCPADCGPIPAESCADGADNDCDGDVDCDDADCGADPACAAPAGVTVSALFGQGFVDEDKWYAEATLTLTGPGGPLADVEVRCGFAGDEYKWKKTGGNGQITMESEEFEGGPNSVTFNITNVDHPDYDAGASMTSITINRP